MVSHPKSRRIPLFFPGFAGFPAKSTLFSPVFSKNIQIFHFFYRKMPLQTGRAFCMAQYFYKVSLRQSQAYLPPDGFRRAEKDQPFLFCLLFSFRKASLCPGSGIPAARRLPLGRKRSAVSFLLTFSSRKGSPEQSIPAAQRILRVQKRLFVSFLLTFFFSQRKK